MFTEALNGYAAQGSYHPNDRFEVYKILITSNKRYLWGVEDGIHFEKAASNHRLY